LESLMDLAVWFLASATARKATARRQSWRNIVIEMVDSAS
jgi:hypothetical protein